MNEWIQAHKIGVVLGGVVLLLLVYVYFRTRQANATDTAGATVGQSSTLEGQPYAVYQFLPAPTPGSQATGSSTPPAPVPGPWPNPNGYPTVGSQGIPITPQTPITSGRLLDRLQQTPASPSSSGYPIGLASPMPRHLATPASVAQVYQAPVAARYPAPTLSRTPLPAHNSYNTWTPANFIVTSTGGGRMS
jgi:hypothetical protein